MGETQASLADKEVKHFIFRKTLERNKEEKIQLKL
jgi:hypothetical protein